MGAIIGFTGFVTLLSIITIVGEIVDKFKKK